MCLMCLMCVCVCAHNNVGVWPTPPLYTTHMCIFIATVPPQLTRISGMHGAYHTHIKYARALSENECVCRSQAALGPIALDLARRSQSAEHIHLANNVLVVSVLAIVLTAPLGAVLMIRLAPLWLQREPSPSSQSTGDVDCADADVDDDDDDEQRRRRRANVVAYAETQHV